MSQNRRQGNLIRAGRTLALATLIAISAGCSAASDTPDSILSPPGAEAFDGLQTDEAFELYVEEIAKLWEVDIDEARRRLVLRENLDWLVEAVHEIVPTDTAAGMWIDWRPDPVLMVRVVGEQAASELRAALGDHGGALEIYGDAVHSTAFLQEVAYQFAVGVNEATGGHVGGYIDENNGRIVVKATSELYAEVVRLIPVLVDSEIPVVVKIDDNEYS